MTNRGPNLVDKSRLTPKEFEQNEGTKRNRFASKLPEVSLKTPFREIIWERDILLIED